MDFDEEKDFSIFEPLLSKRPEIIPESLKKDLSLYYLPYIKKLINLKQKKNTSDGLIIGVLAIQGVGKTTQGEILEILLSHFGFSSISCSIDDHYITHRELSELRQKDPRFIRRGVTHDLALAVLNLRDLREMTNGFPVLISGYDKGVHLGDGDRFRFVNLDKGITLKIRVSEKELMVNKQLQQVLALELISIDLDGKDIGLPKNMGSDIPVLEHFLPSELIEFLKARPGQAIEVSTHSGNVIFKNSSDSVTISKKDLPNCWRLVTKKPDFIFYDGWMVGARMVEDESVFDQNLPALETEEDRQFAKDVNKKLESYETLWQMFEFMNVLYVPDYQISLKWRDQAEGALRDKGEGMSHEEIEQFVHYFWRSVHPAIHIKNLAYDATHTQQVVLINDDHTIKEVLTPAELSVRYP